MRKMIETMIFLVDVVLWLHYFLLLLCCEACSSSCPVLDCWFVQERVGRGGGLTAPTTQEKSLLHIRKSSQSVEPSGIPSDINPEKVFYVTGECNLPLCLVIMSVTLLYYGEYVLKVLKYSGFEVQALYCIVAFDLNCEFVNLMDLYTNQYKKIPSQCILWR